MIVIFFMNENEIFFLWMLSFDKTPNSEKFMIHKFMKRQDLIQDSDN